MSIGSRTGNPRDDRAAMRALYINILVSTVGLAAYDVADDANLDNLDDIVESLYSRIPAKVVDGVRDEVRLPQAAALPVPGSDPDREGGFKTVDPEPA